MARSSLRSARGESAGRVPASLGPMVGRERELADLEARLAGGARLITLVGPPGTGKTTLALALARQARGSAFFVDLTPCLDVGSVASAMAAALGVRVQGHPDVEELVARVSVRLRRGSPLVVIDNFEHVVASAPTLARWLEDSGRARFVVTSRELLRIPGEVAFEVSALGVPPPDADLELIRQSEAVRLLSLRTPRAEIADDDLRDVARIVRRLDGIPLAIELAAARLPLLGAARLAERLEAGLDALGPGRRGASPRQATLRGAVEWSWRLLEAREQAALTVLSLFRGDFSVEAAIATIARAQSEKAEALTLLTSLCDKSLVARTGTRGTRLRLLESVRELARSHLSDDDATERLARYLASEAQARLAELGTRKARDAFDWLLVERDALSSALDATQEDPSPALAATRAALLLALDPVVTRVGPAGSHAARLDLAIAARAQLDASWVTKLLLTRARLRRDGGEMAAALADLDDAITLTQGAERAAARVERGTTLLGQGRFDDAAKALESALREARSYSSRPIEQRALAAAALVAHGRGRLDEAEEGYSEALDLAAELGDAHAVASARRDLGNLCLQRGDAHRARAYYEDALAARGGDDLRIEGIVRGNLGILEQESGELEEAVAQFKKALTCLRKVGDRPFEAHILGYLGTAHHERGRLDAARVAYSDAIEILEEVQDLRALVIFSSARASCEAARGRVGTAQNDLAVARRRSRDVGDPALDALLAIHSASVSICAASDADARADALSAAERAAKEGRAHVRASDDVRFALRMLTRSLPAQSLVVGPGASWFRVPGRERVSLERRPTLARVLDALASARITKSDQPLDLDALSAAGWPGEKMMPLAARNRVRVAVTTLRNLGLRDVLVHRDGGHLLAVATERGD